MLNSMYATDVACYFYLQPAKQNLKIRIMQRIPSSHNKSVSQPSFLFHSMMENERGGIKLMKTEEDKRGWNRTATMLLQYYGSDRYNTITVLWFRSLQYGSSHKWSNFIQKKFGPDRPSSIRATHGPNFVDFRFSPNFTRISWFVLFLVVFWDVLGPLDL